MAGLPAISLVGPRACGKTTSARRLAADTVSLNKAEDAAAFLASPDAALARLAEPALVDEWQDAPPVLGAVKRAVDEDPRAGRFILTGSVSIETGTKTWPATGRVTRLNMYALTQREILGVSGELFVDRAVRAEQAELPGADRRLNVFDYLALAAAGGFLDVVIRRSGLARELWLASYLVELLSKDAKRAGTGTAIDYTRLAAYATAVAASSAKVSDTFAASQIRPELAVSRLRPTLHHLRDKGGRHEVDTVLDYGARGVVGIEVKSSSAPSRDDAKHLLWLRERLGERFAAGLVLHTGGHTFELSDKITAAPISTLWAADRH
ncbi:MAG: AAA family ATPase [Bifidobacteriaceae bacterium]|nr:AAA family ATPase [Bifidobacteriaceae bacterium]